MPLLESARWLWESVVATGRIAWLFVTPAFVLVAAVLVLPSMVGLARSFLAVGSGQATFVGLRNYQLLLADPEGRTAITNGVVYALLSAPVSVAVGLGLAAMIAGARRREWLRLLCLGSWLPSPIAVGVLWRFFLNSPIGLPNFLLTVAGYPLALGPLSNPVLALPTAAGVDVWRSSPLVAFLLVPGVAAIPRDLREQARLDGAGRWQVFRTVWLPPLRPLLTVLLLFRLADALSASATLYTLTHGGPVDRTTTLALYGFLRSSIGQDPDRALASAWLVVLLALALGAGCLWLARER